MIAPGVLVNCRYRAYLGESLAKLVHRMFTDPNVPDSIPAEGIIALDGLLKFVVKGTGSLPSGSLPGMPQSLRDLELNNTAIGPLDISLFAGSGGLSKLETLVLVRNMNMGGSISDGIPGLSLKSLYVHIQLDAMPLNKFPQDDTKSGRRIASFELSQLYNGPEPDVP